MRIVVGLGNPGEEYKLTRHNIGFLIIDSILSISQGSRLKAQGRFKAEIAEISVKAERVLLVKPMTFMNKSGEAVRRVVEYYLTPGDPFHVTPGVSEGLFIVHDELDLPLAKLQIRRNISSAGHKGVQSIIDALGTQDFIRFRVGVGRGDENYLLSDFTREEMEVVEPAIKRTAEAAIYALENGVEEAMGKYN